METQIRFNDIKQGDYIKISGFLERQIDPDEYPGVPDNFELLGEVTDKGDSIYDTSLNGKLVKITNYNYVLSYYKLLQPARPTYNQLMSREYSFGKKMLNDLAYLKMI